MPPMPNPLEIEAVRAFAANDFDTALATFEKAQAEGPLSGMAEQYLDTVRRYVHYWKTEQDIRAREAEADDLPRVKFETSKGDVVIELLENEAPNAVANFVHLVEQGYYDGLTFHRVIANFMAQGGCPTGSGSGGPGWRIACECDEPNARKHFRGSLSMAHAGRDTGGSQFFLTFVPTDHLNGKHTVFGRVIEGMEHVDQLERIDPRQSGPKPDTINRATVIRKRDHAYEPKKR